MDDLMGGWLGRALQECVDEDRPLPFTVLAVGKNGSVMAVRYTARDGDSLDVKLVAEHVEPPAPGFIAPINILICDGGGGVVHLVVNASRLLQRIH